MKTYILRTDTIAMLSLSKLQNSLVFLMTLLIFIPLNSGIAQSRMVYDDFEGNGTITTWYGDNCGIDTDFINPVRQGINTSLTVLRYEDAGGRYANIGFDVPNEFDLSDQHTFSLKIYVPKSGITGNQPNQVSLKLQNADLGQPWITQTEIIKPIELDKWQEIEFDFLNDPFINLDPSSPAPVDRIDLNRVLIQVNGEDNFAKVIAYIDDVRYDGELPPVPVYNDLVWADEFEIDGPVNAENWFHQTRLPQNGSWYNGEIQHYTDRQANTYVDNGILNIVAKRERYTDQGHTKEFTSARLNSKFAFTYGRVEVRAKLPRGVGTWPAIWMLGKNINERGAYWYNQGYGRVSWPQCGEIDIMEHWGSNLNYVSSAIHTPSSFGATMNVGGRNLPNATSEFHTYTVEWTERKIIFSIDGEVHYVYKPQSKNARTWPFDLDQYLILNVAILPDIDPAFRQSAMELDYVRVYQSSRTSSVKKTGPEVLTAYPNPFHDQVTVEIDNNSLTFCDFQIFDVSGKLILSGAAQRMDHGYVISGLAGLVQGAYFVKLIGDEESCFIRVIKG